MRRLVVHIGAHKTGSTSIQKFLWSYKEYFREVFNIEYPHWNPSPQYGRWGQHHLTWYFAPSDPRVNPKVYEPSFKFFLHKISSEQTKDFLISSEDFIFNPKINEFVDYVKPFFDEICVIMYVRRQVDAALSLYKTGIANEGFTENFLEWFKGAQPMFYYYKIAQVWKNAGCKVIVRPYKRDKFPHGDVILDFLETLSLIFDRKIAPPHEYESNTVMENVSLPDFIIMMILFYNAQPSKDKVVPILKELGRLIVSLDPSYQKGSYIVPPSVKNAIVEMYKEDNELLCREYLGLEYLDWLNEKVQESEESYIERFGYPGAHLVELAKAILNLCKK